ncbi:hypothetical protein Tco_1524415 [Tanacetum coccineum]
MPSSLSLSNSGHRPPTAGHRRQSPRRRRKTFSANFSGRTQNRSSSSDLTDPHYHAPPRDHPTTTSPLPSLHHHPITTVVASSPSSPPPADLHHGHHHLIVIITATTIAAIPPCHPHRCHGSPTIRAFGSWAAARGGFGLNINTSRVHLVSAWHQEGAAGLCYKHHGVRLSVVYKQRGYPASRLCGKMYMYDPLLGCT